jgi:hypothetical protein
LARAGDIVATPDHFECGPAAKEQTKGEEPLRGNAVVIVPVTLCGRGRPGSTEADPPQDRTLQRNTRGQPVLTGRPQRNGRGRDAEGGWRQVVVASVEAPDTSVVIAVMIIRAVEQAAQQDIVNGVLAWPLISKSK